MKWVTRAGIRVNRAATAWLIRRFVDPEAEFVFVDPGDVARVQASEGAIGFDAPGARYPHEDARHRCSFEALVDEHCPHDGVLQQLARIVHAADFSAEVGQVPEAAGLRAISEGFPLVTRDDFETVQRAGWLYDALYAALAARHGEPPRSGLRVEPR
ncbi:MAG TPA: chromate resistance protein ChrB domain-containing protein [Planctomycetota bacterium]|nr:chromate resistance protein ChrB domain-containing protein [Planctomycetota bacterium]